MEFKDLLKTLKNDFSEIKFKKGSNFLWSPKDKIVFYTKDKYGPALIMHEIGHYTLGHKTYAKDIDLLKMEREAWTEAIKLADKYKLVIDGEFIEDALDTYRDWLHSRSLCPNCNQNGVQNSKNTYTCLLCSQKWKVNESKNCHIRRLKIK